MKLSIITATHKSRSKWLRMCCEQVQSQSISGVVFEHIIISDGSDDTSRATAKRYGASYTEIPSPRGAYGAYCKDIGAQIAKGEYLVYFDDDNVFHPHAIASLYTSAQGVDIGVCQTVHQGRVIPEKPVPPFVYASVDTMCFCVRKELAIKERWDDVRVRGIDFDWLNLLQNHSPSIRFVPIIIGEHLA